jgi:pyruvate carboxylase subunit B
MKRVDVMVTAFRDGFQSVYGARVLTADFLPALEAAKEAGITHFEIGGGARFQSLYFYCNEDAFDMMDACRQTVGPEANLQTLARGVNVVGLDSQSSDIIRMHAELFKKHGVTTVRNFDALNDVENLDYSGRCIHDAGLQHEVCVTLMGLPPGISGAHDEAFYTATLKKILDAGVPFSSICYKDASGTATPETVYQSIKAARKLLGPDVHLRYHTHETAGTSIICNKAALEAGANGIDLSMVPVSGGTAQPDVVAMWHALRGTDYDLGIDIDKVLEAEEVFKEQMADYFQPPEAAAVEPMIPFSPMPGGALTANTQMMRDNGTLDRFPEIIGAMKEVVARGGFGTSVTPVSQFYFQQAFNNVFFGPWKRIAEGYGKMVLGYFGKTPLPPDPEIVGIAAEQLGLEPTTESAREINDRDPKKGRAAAEARLEAEGLEKTEENIFISATCLEKGIAFLKGEATVNVRKKKPKQTGPRHYAVTVDGTPHTVSIDGNAVSVGGRQVAVQVAEGPGTGAAPGGQGAPAQQATTSQEAAANAPGCGDEVGVAVQAPMPGVVLRVLVKQGQSVKCGDSLLVLEAMKMESEVFAPNDGIVQSVDVTDGEKVQSGQPLLFIG